MSNSIPSGDLQSGLLIWNYFGSNTWNKKKKCFLLGISLCNKPVTCCNSTRTVHYQTHPKKCAQSRRRLKSDFHSLCTFHLIYTSLFFCIPFLIWCKLISMHLVWKAKEPRQLNFMKWKPNVSCVCQLFWRITQWGLNPLLYLLLSKCLLLYMWGESQQSSFLLTCHLIFTDIS